MNTKRHLLVTSALPYANGSLHLGHLVETIQTDVWVRFQKLRGHTCHYMCADDTHGTPIMLQAKKQNLTPEALIEAIHTEHKADFKDFLIDFDLFYTTHSPENKALSAEIFEKGQHLGVIDEKSVEQCFCEQCSMFLPDRLIRGTCPSCKAEDQYGDGCEKCSSIYEPTQLISPRCAECGNPPIIKSSRHFFFKLSHFEAVIKTWMETGAVQAEVQNKIREWFTQGLRDWDISREAPYFGFEIPGHPGKYFYVWLDAPIGYIATTKHWAEKNGVDFNDIWKGDKYEIHHFIGKDILYFHTLFWPALLSAGGFSLPKKVNVHGFLTVNGEKMSKSRGTFIKARTYLDHLPPEFLRYYFVSKLTSSIDDLDFNPDDFVFKVNADIVNKVVNIGSRLGSVLNKKCGGKLGPTDSKGQAILDHFYTQLEPIAAAYETLDYALAMRMIMGLADMANKYIDEQAPWAVANTDTEAAVKICTAGLHMLRVLSGLLKPVMPNLAAGVESFLQCSPITWDTLIHPIQAGSSISAYTHLAQRVDLETVKKLFVL
jgi:methionyl-tRNA synthetase